MAEDFDPYFKWLGIPPDEQPPNHYRLLGVPLYTDDDDVIENAADRQMSHVRTFQSGKNVKLTQQILNQVAAAKLCLLDAKDKAAYDRALRDSLDEANKPTRLAKPVDAPKPTAKPKESSAPPRTEPVLTAAPLPPSRKTSLVLVAVAVVVLRSANSAEAKTAAAQRALDMSEQAIAADRFGEAEGFARTALAATSRARDAESRNVRTRATELIRNIKSLEEQWKSVQSAIETLETDADDAAANLILGKYLCFAKGDWQQGLTHLAKSGDAQYAAVATAEHQAPSDANEIMNLGDAWWDLVADAAEFEKQPIIARACHWYRRSLSAGLTGLERKRVEKRLEESDTT